MSSLFLALLFEAVENVVFFSFLWLFVIAIDFGVFALILTNLLNKVLFKKAALKLQLLRRQMKKKITFKLANLTAFLRASLRPVLLLPFIFNLGVKSIFLGFTNLKEDDFFTNSF
jgi:hypothetical protein